MFYLLHTFSPQSIIITLGPISLHWYGLFIVIAITTALIITQRLGKKYYNLDSEKIFDLSFWLIIWGVIGARVYDIFLQLPYYINHPLQTLQIWKGGLAIHGAILAGLIVIFYFSRKNKINFFKITALFVPGLALGQAIGRFGNYFNQELFGLPTNLPWGIPIEAINRPAEFITFKYFQPTFLYESLGCLLIFIILYQVQKKYHTQKIIKPEFYIWFTAMYMILYSLLRFSLEFIRIDYAPVILGLRLPQIASLILILLSLLILIKKTNVFAKYKK